MAETAAGTAWVLAPPSPADPSQVAEPSEDSVWSRIKHPNLKTNPKIDNINWMNSKEEAVLRTLWSREGEFFVFGSKQERGSQNK